MTISARIIDIILVKTSRYFVNVSHKRKWLGIYRKVYPVFELASSLRNSLDKTITRRIISHFNKAFIDQFLPVLRHEMNEHFYHELISYVGIDDLQEVVNKARELRKLNGYEDYTSVAKLYIEKNRHFHDYMKIKTARQ